MKQFFEKLVYAILILLYGGGIICGLVFSITAKSVTATLAIIVLGVMALPSAKKCLEKLTEL